METPSAHRAVKVNGTYTTARLNQKAIEAGTTGLKKDPPTRNWVFVHNDDKRRSHLRHVRYDKDKDAFVQKKRKRYILSPTGLNGRKLKQPEEGPVPSKDYKWDCDVVCQQCTHVVNGTRCKRKACLALPFCWQHLKSEKGLRIKKPNAKRYGGPSDETNASLKKTNRADNIDMFGLFATRKRGMQADEQVVFKANEAIIDSEAEHLSTAEKNRRYGDDAAGTLLLQVKNGNNPTIYFDGACKRGPLVYAKTAGNTRTSALTGKNQANAKLQLVPGQQGRKPSLRLVATKPIKKEEEILICLDWLNDGKTNCSASTLTARKEGTSITVRQNPKRDTKDYTRPRLNAPRIRVNQQPPANLGQ